MAFKIAEAYVEFSQRGVANVNKGVSTAEKSMRGLATAGRLATAAITGLAAGVVVRGMMSFVEAAAEAEKQTAKLAAVLKTTEGVSGQTVKSLEDHASALQRVTAFEDDTIKGAQAVLLTFKKIGGETFPQATEAALDLATVFEGDLKGSAMMVGKALEDPIRGITALRRAGVSFTKDQQDVIASLVKTGEVAKAQAMILKEINSQVGGAAKAVGDTTAGGIEQLRNAAGDAAEAIGAELVPAMRGLAEFLKDNLSKASGFGIVGPATAKLAQTEGDEEEWRQVNEGMRTAKTFPEFAAFRKRLRDLTNRKRSEFAAGMTELEGSVSWWTKSPDERESERMTLEKNLRMWEKHAAKLENETFERGAFLPEFGPQPIRKGETVIPFDQNLLNEMGGLDAGLRGRDVAAERAAAQETAEIMRNYSNLQRNPGIGGRKGGAFAGYPDVPLQGPAGYSAFKDAPAGVFGQFDKLVRQFDGLTAKTDAQTDVLKDIRDKIGSDDVARFE